MTKEIRKVPDHRFKDQSIRIVVVGVSSSIRQVFTSVFKEMGYRSVTGVSNIKSAVEIIETEAVDWIVSPLQDGEEKHVLQLLDIINSHQQLRFIKVSCYGDNGMHHMVPKCFEYGLFTYHSSNPTIAETKSEISEILDMLDRYDGDFRAVASYYLRNCLAEEEEFQEIVRFERCLLAVDPQNLDSLISLADSLFRLKREEEAKTAIFQATLIDPSFGMIKEVMLEHLNRESLDATETEMIASHLGFNVCLVVDSDLYGAEKSRALLENMGFGKVVIIDNPLKALPWLRKNKAPDLIISEWQLPTLPGPVFLYKIRNRLKCQAPLVIMNDHIKDIERPMVQELGADSIIHKPMNDHGFHAVVSRTIQQSRYPTEPSAMKLKLRRALAAEDHQAVHTMKKAIFSSKTMTDSDKVLIESEIAYENGCYIHSKKLALESIHLGGPSTESLSVLGKSLMQLREFDAALRCLENCSFVNPMNVDHLCDIAECHLENGDNESYSKALDQAKAIDHNERVMSTEAKGAIQNGHIDTARKLLERLHSYKDVLAYTNNRAVTLIRCGDFDIGIDLYNKALASIPKNKRELESLIRYNLGLAYARHNDLEVALTELKKGEISKNKQRRKKIDSLKKRIIVSIEKGVPLVLKAPDKMTEEDERERMAAYVQLERDLKSPTASPFESCLLKIYQTELACELAEQALKKGIAFTFRGKIKKDFRGLQQVSG